MATLGRPCLTGMARSWWRAPVRSTLFRLCNNSSVWRNSSVISRITRKLFSKKSASYTKFSPVAATEWTPIYRFKLIPLIALISQAKILQTMLTVVLVPVVWWRYMEGKGSVEWLEAICVATVVALVMLYVMTAYTRRTVGVISKHRVQDVIRIGYLNFWGFRRNVIMPVEDLVPLCDISYDKNSAYVKLERYNDESFKLYLPLKKYEIVDEKIFCEVFGALLK